MRKRVEGSSGVLGGRAEARPGPSLGLLLAGDGALGSLAGARVGLGALAADRKALAVTATLVAADLDLAPDVGLDLTAEVTLDLDLVVALDRVAELDQLFVTQLVDAEVGVHAGLGENLLGAGTADAVDVGECDLDALVTREVNTNEACHEWLFLSRATAALRYFTVVWSCRVSCLAAGAPAIRSGGGLSPEGPERSREWMY